MANIFSKHRSKLREQSKKAKQGEQKQTLNKQTVSKQTVVKDCLSVDKAEDAILKGAKDDLHDLPAGLIKCEILSLSHEGRGIAKNKGKTQFVHQALPGELVLASIISHKAKYDELNAERILLASDQRVAPRCVHFGECGGCSLQHLSHDAQVLHKQSVLAEQLHHFGSLDPEQWLPAIVDAPWAYRSRCRLGVDYGKQGHSPRVGFRKKGSKHILDIKECPILQASAAEILPSLKALLGSLSSAKAIGHVELMAHAQGIAILLRHVKALSDRDIKCLIEFAEAHSCVLFLQGGDASSVKKIWPQHGDEYLSYYIEKGTRGEGALDAPLQLFYHPKDFTQVNPKVNQEMLGLALRELDIQPQDRVLDLFSGLGNFTLAMAQRAQYAVGVEGSRDMVERGQMNAQRNGLENVAFHETNLYENFQQKAWAQETYDKILLDPPRAGALEVVTAIAGFKAKRIVYISCNPATLARDAGVLIQQGYRLSQAGVLDMFPHTEHVESIAIFDSEKAE